MGRQQWPTAVRVETEEDYLFLIRKEKEVIQFKSKLSQLLQWNCDITEILSKNPFLVLQLQNSWDGICAVVDFLISNDVRNHYVRSIPVPVHTKFIQTHQQIILSLIKELSPKRLVDGAATLETALELKTKSHIYLLRWLDKSLAVWYMHGIEILGLTTETLQSAEWEVKEVWLVENETNLYLMPERKNAIVIFSSGYALALLKGINILQNRRLFYWGDLDEDGFKMLGLMRKYYAHVKSVFMDIKTVNAHIDGITTQPAKYGVKNIELLTSEEIEAFELLLLKNGRLEQEKLDQKYVFDYFTNNVL